MTTRYDVEFATHDGIVLRGWLYRPDGDRDAPGIVMTHGFSATREMGLPGHVEAFAAAGMAVLPYDHRALGASQGSPRQLIDPFVQTRDMMAAVGWLAEQPGIDGDRIGLWGTSYSGAEALILAALDPRVRAVATIVPAVGRVDAVHAEPRAAWEAIAARVLGATIDPDAVVGPRAVVPEPGAPPIALMPDPDTTTWILAEGARTAGLWRNKVLTPRWADGDPGLDPAPALPFLQAPILLIGGDADRVTPADGIRGAADLAGDKAEYLLLAGHHCSFYAGAPRDLAAKAAIDFYRRHL